uniref:Uncharacterized protein n=1 Tax=Eutreptiella gymnastica TaxID=73025 RepID=A0A7S4LG05_9EUGL
MGNICESCLPAGYTEEGNGAPHVAEDERKCDWGDNPNMGTLRYVAPICTPQVQAMGMEAMVAPTLQRMDLDTSYGKPTTIQPQLHHPTAYVDPNTRCDVYYEADAQAPTYKAYTFSFVDNKPQTSYGVVSSSPTYLRNDPDSAKSDGDQSLRALARAPPFQAMSYNPDLTSSKKVPLQHSESSCQLAPVSAVDGCGGSYQHLYIYHKQKVQAPRPYRPGRPHPPVVPRAGPKPQKASESVADTDNTLSSGVPMRLDGSLDPPTPQGPQLATLSPAVLLDPLPDPEPLPRKVSIPASVFMMGADPPSPYGTPSPRSVHSVSVEPQTMDAGLSGPKPKIVKLSRKRPETIFLPASDRAFWEGYNVPATPDSVIMNHSAQDWQAPPTPERIMMDGITFGDTIRRGSVRRGSSTIRSRSGSVGMGYGDPHPYSRTPTSVGSFRPGFGSRSGSVSGGVVMTTDGVPPLMPQGSSASLLRSTSAPPQQFQGSVSSQASVSQHGWGSPGQGSGSPNSGSLARRSSHGSATASVASLPVRAGSAVHTYTHRASFSGAATQSGW